MRNTQTLTSKAHTHTVKQIGPTVYEVTSGASGNTYSVRIMDGKAQCCCKWGFTGNGIPQRKECGCSHTIAVFAFIEEQKGRTVSAFQTIEEAKRQHRPVIEMGDGIVLTSRS